MSQAASVRSYRLFAAAAAFISIALSLMVLAGWWLHIRALTSIVPGLVTMKPNTAVCFLLISICILLLREPIAKFTPWQLAKLWLARCCALFTVVIGVGSFIERVFGLDLGIDLLFFRNALLATKVPQPGLMAAASGAGFFLMGAAIFLIDWETPHR